MITVALFFLRRCLTPPLSFPAIFLERSTTLSSLKLTELTESPNSSARFIKWNTSAERSIAFVGMHPQFKQIPPRCSRSTTATFMPSCAPLIADTYPPGPAPITIMS